jgi:hypothetical protein
MSDDLKNKEAVTAKAEASTKIKPTKTGVKVEFIKSPTGLFGLGYNVGESDTFDKKQADILIDSGVAKKA